MAETGALFITVDPTVAFDAKAAAVLGSRMVDALLPRAAIVVAEKPLLPAAIKRLGHEPRAGRRPENAGTAVALSCPGHRLERRPSLRRSG